MKSNPISYMGFLGFLGLAGLINGNVGFYGFFGFFGFFGLARQRDDEMLRHNMARAGLNAFVVSLIGFSVAIVGLSIVKSPEAIVAFFTVYFALLFVAQILTFVISFNLYEKRGDLG